MKQVTALVLQYIYGFMSYEVLVDCFIFFSRLLFSKIEKPKDANLLLCAVLAVVSVGSRHVVAADKARPLHDLAEVWRVYVAGGTQHAVDGFLEQGASW
jgi:hypothetical protein